MELAQPRSTPLYHFKLRQGASIGRFCWSVGWSVENFLPASNLAKDCRSHIFWSLLCNCLVCIFFEECPLNIEYFLPTPSLLSNIEHNKLLLQTNARSKLWYSLWNFLNINHIISFKLVRYLFLLFNISYLMNFSLLSYLISHKINSVTKII